ncbi:MAG: cell division protein SepF [bacterium]|nr:cell division protein SepF [bacterium]MCY4256932.1 cell division protein SepF [bacterium]
MSSVWQKTKYWLGFGTEEEFGQHLPPEYDTDMRLVPGVQGAVLPDGGAEMSSVRQLPGAVAPQEASSGAEVFRHSAVRPVPSAPVKPSVVTPTSFDDAKEVGDCFRNGLAVIVNLQHSTRDVARRLIDFSSGLCYGLDGRMERVADHVYLLSPSNVEISAEERRRMEQADYQGN